MSYHCRMRMNNSCGHPLFLLLRTWCCILVLCATLDDVDGIYVWQRFMMEPQDQTAIIGSRVILPCRVEKRIGRVQWTKNEFGLGLSRDLTDFNGYKMIGSDEENDFSLDIKEVNLEDDAKFQCQVTSGIKSQPAIRSRSASLTVIIPPESPVILQGSFYSTTEDRIIKLECVSAAGKPAAEITWVDTNGAALTQGVTHSVEVLADEKRYTARSVIRITPKQQHHNQTFTCQAQNTADRTYRTASILIEVKYAPKVKVQIYPGKRVPEGTDVYINCTAEANPSNMTMRWVLNSSIISNTTELKLPKISRAYNGAVVKCMVINEVGKSEETDTLEITYPPTFRNLPKDVEAEVGKQVTLSCDVDGFPAPEIIWLHYEEDTNLRVGRTANLTLTVDTHTTGRYLCKARVEGYPEIEAEASIYTRGLPKIISNRTQYGSEGGVVNIECAAYSVPRADSIIWTHEDKEIDTVHDHDYLFREDIQPGGIVNFTLTVRESQAKHFGIYTCNISNDYGSEVLEIVLKRSRNLYLLLIIFGATSGTILLAALIIVVILCQKKQKKTKETRVTEKPDVTVTTEEHCKENDRKSNISDLKLELRQASGSNEIDYSNAGSDSTLCSNAKLGSGIPLAGTVALSSINHTRAYPPYRYSNDYSDAAYVDFYKVTGYGNGHQTYVHYGHEYAPSSLRIQSPTLGSDKFVTTRSINGSLPRSVDTPLSIQYNASVGSHTNSLQRATKRQESTITLNTLASDGARVTNGGKIQGIDVRYAATYCNPHLRAGLNTINASKPPGTPAPPPYSSVRNSIILPSGTSSHSITSPTSLASPQCATSPITNSTMSTDSAPPNVGMTSSATPQSPNSHYILAPSNRSLSNAVVTKKGNQHQATHV